MLRAGCSLIQRKTGMDRIRWTITALAELKARRKNVAFRHQAARFGSETIFICFQS